MAKKKRAEHGCECPVGRFLEDLDKAFGRQSEFSKHMTQSRIEFLKGIRSLVDERIDNLEQMQAKKGKKKMTKIKVE
jgi:hypothetical protein